MRRPRKLGIRVQQLVFIYVLVLRKQLNLQNLQNINNIIYIIYMGDTGRLRDRFRERLSDVERNDKDASKPVARHFKFP